MQQPPLVGEISGWAPAFAGEVRGEGVGQRQWSLHGGTLGPLHYGPWSKIESLAQAALGSRLRGNDTEFGEGIVQRGACFPPVR